MSYDDDDDYDANDDYFDYLHHIGPYSDDSSDDDYGCYNGNTVHDMWTDHTTNVYTGGDECDCGGDEDDCDYMPQNYPTEKAPSDVDLDVKSLWPLWLLPGYSDYLTRKARYTRYLRDIEKERLRLADLEARRRYLQEKGADFSDINPYITSTRLRLRIAEENRDAEKEKFEAYVRKTRWERLSENLVMIFLIGFIAWIILWIFVF